MSASPFIPGVRYRVIANYEELGHKFASGSTVVFVNSAYDPHNGVTRYWFKLEGSDDLNAWHVWDDDPTAAEKYREKFQKCAT